jgi:hypothetical protein
MVARKTAYFARENEVQVGATANISRRLTLRMTMTEI